MLRQATLDDMPEIRRLNEQAVRLSTKGFYPENIITQWSGSFLDWYYPTIFCEHHSKSITYVDTDSSYLSGVGRAIENEIYFLFIDPQHQNKGIGSQILAQLERDMKKNHALAHVLSTLNAVPFYKKHGYEPIESDGYDIGNGLWLECLKMTKQL